MSNSNQLLLMSADCEFDFLRKIEEIFKNRSSDFLSLENLTLTNKSLQDLLPALWSLASFLASNPRNKVYTELNKELSPNLQATEQ
jgi:hypothetical protein